MRVLRAVKKRKKVRKLGAIDSIRREAYADLELDAKVELIRALVRLGLLHVQELLDEEVTALAGEHYARKAASIGGRRHGSNPGTVSPSKHERRFAPSTSSGCTFDTPVLSDAHQWRLMGRFSTWAASSLEER